MKSQVFTSEITRPYVLSVQGDIPVGAQIKVNVKGEWPIGPHWSKDYVNPQRAVLVTPQVKNFSFSLQAPEQSLAVPFLHAIVIEGDRQKHVYKAKQLAQSADLRKIGLMLMEPEDEEPFITPAWSSALHIPVSQVSCCETTRPWVLHVDGSAPGHSRLKLELIGHEPDGSEWERTYIAEDGVDTYHVIREELPSTTFTYGGFLTQMEASPDGHYTPFLHGIAFEGDNRRLYLSAANLIGDNEVPENLELIKGATSGFSCLMLKHSMPAWFGFPSAMERVMQLCIAGELRPSWMPDNDELTDEEEGIDEEDDEDAVP